MGNYLGSEKVNPETIFEPFLEINEKLENDLYLVTYRYPDDKINMKKMKYYEIVDLAKKLNVEINELPDVLHV